MPHLNQHELVEVEGATLVLVEHVKEGLRQKISLPKNRVVLILFLEYLTFFEKLLLGNFPVFVLFEELIIQNQNLDSVVCFSIGL